MVRTHAREEIREMAVRRPLLVLGAAAVVSLCLGAQVSLDLSACPNPSWAGGAWSCATRGDALNPSPTSAEQARLILEIAKATQRVADLQAQLTLTSRHGNLGEVGLAGAAIPSDTSESELTPCWSPAQW